MSKINNQPDDRGGPGELWPRQENQLIHMAVVRRWPIDDEVKKQVVAATVRNLNHSNARVVNGAARNAIAMERQCQADEIAAIVANPNLPECGEPPLSPAELVRLMDATIPHRPPFDNSSSDSPDASS